MYRLETTNAFEKSLKRLTSNEQRIIALKLLTLRNDPFHPSLRTKKVRKFNDTFESSVNMDIRILWKHEGDRIILIINVGRHDILP